MLDYWPVQRTHCEPTSAFNPHVVWLIRVGFQPREHKLVPSSDLEIKAVPRLRRRQLDTILEIYDDCHARNIPLEAKIFNGVHNGSILSMPS